MWLEGIVGETERGEEGEGREEMRTGHTSIGAKAVKKKIRGKK